MGSFLPYFPTPLWQDRRWREKDMAVSWCELVATTVYLWPQCHSITSMYPIKVPPSFLPYNTKALWICHTWWCTCLEVWHTSKSCSFFFFVYEYGRQQNTKQIKPATVLSQPGLQFCHVFRCMIQVCNNKVYQIFNILTFMKWRPACLWKVDEFSMKDCYGINHTRMRTIKPYSWQWMHNFVF